MAIGHKPRPGKTILFSFFLCKNLLRFLPFIGYRKLIYFCQVKTYDNLISNLRKLISFKWLKKFVGVRLFKKSCYRAEAGEILGKEAFTGEGSRREYPSDSYRIKSLIPK
jgi:hypothetical protein